MPSPKIDDKFALKGDRATGAKIPVCFEILYERVSDWGESFIAMTMNV